MITGTTRATPVLLWSRAVLLAAVVLAVSAVGHVSADGRLPGPVAMLGLLAATTVVSARFLSRQASGRRIVSLLVVGQAAVHGMLTLLAGHGPTVSSPRTSGAGWVFDGRHAERTGSYFDQVAAMQAGGVAHAASAPVVPPADAANGAAHGGAYGAVHLVEHVAAQGVAMLLAHLAAVALLGAWLAVGERALWTVLTLTTTRLVGVVGHSLALVLGWGPSVLLERVRRAPYLPSTGRVVVPLPHLLHHVVAHRGPPALLAA